MTRNGNERSELLFGVCGVAIDGVTMHDKLTATFLVTLLVLSGGSAFALATGAHEDAAESRMVTGEVNIQQQSPNEVLVFADDYTPGTSFQVITRLKQGAVREILGQTVNDRPVISDTSEYTGYVVNLQSAGNVSGEYGLVFVDREEGRLMMDTQYQFEADAMFFRVDINLLQTGIRSAGGDTTTEGGTPTPTPEEGTPTPMPEEGTPTPEGGTPTPAPTSTPEEGTPTPEAQGGDGNETTPVAEGNTTVADAAEGNSFVSSIVDFLGGLFGSGSNEGAQVTTTIEGGGGS